MKNEFVNLLLQPLQAISLCLHLLFIFVVNATVVYIFMVTLNENHFVFLNYTPSIDELALDV